MQKGDTTFRVMVVSWLVGLTGAAVFSRWLFFDHARKHFGLHGAASDMEAAGYEVLTTKIKYLEERVAELEAAAQGQS